MSHITVQHCDMTDDAAGMAMTTMCAMTLVVMRFERCRVINVQAMCILVSVRVFATSGIDCTFDTHKE